MTVYDIRPKNRKHLFNWLTVVLLVTVLVLAGYIVYIKVGSLSEAKDIGAKAWESLVVDKQNPKWVAQQVINAFNKDDEETIEEYCSTLCIYFLASCFQAYYMMSWVQEQPRLYLTMTDFERISQDSAKASIAVNIDSENATKYIKRNPELAKIYQLDMIYVNQEWQCWSFSPKPDK
ncbi:MAG: hypothetical protein PHY48_09035 [Candidatus Cloacimonetes bacterium]|jgi:hypothetical protein|nr:hypothetical protein [Candidatus Cloacimonadota bacterium]